MKKLILALVCASSLSFAAEYDPVKAEMLSLSCFSCHGPDGHSVTVTPTIAGMGKTTLYQVLLEYKNGKRTGTMMQKHVKGFSDEELMQVAHYFSTIKR